MNVKVTVNGREIEVPGEMTILQSLLQADINIPHLCYDIRLERANGNCGLCVVELGKDKRDVKSCQTPIKEGMEIITNSPRLEAYRKIRLEQLLSDHNADCVAPCVMTCPANIDIQSYLRHVGNGNHEAAIRVIKDRNPFPSVCGRVCPHPCEAQCRRNLIDEPVAINAVKRYASDWDMRREKPWIPRLLPMTGKKVAIVGAGPSGLSAAYYSAINGHSVTVFERQSYAGGMMRYGIPEYRLPKTTLDREIDIIKNMGVRIQTGKSLGVHIRLEELQNDFDAIYLAIGSWRATSMQIEGENAPGVFLGINYLEQVTQGIDINLGQSVVVIGGGNTAIDCARTALRKGAGKVQLIYRRTRSEMPAEPFEVEEALLEGVEMLFLTAPVKIINETGKAKKLSCIKMDLGEPDRSGRRRPVPVEGSEFIIEADTIIGAIGQSTNTQFLYNDLPVKLNKWGDIEIHPSTLQTSAEKIFAGGDCVTGPATVIQAVGAGRRAAEAMHSLLMHGYVREENANYLCSKGSLEDLPKWEFEEFPKIERAKMPHIKKAERLNGFTEVETGLVEEAARNEARRCLKCGCTERFSCTLRQEARKHGVQYQKPVHERPFIPIVDDHPFIQRDHNKCIACGRCIAACAEIEGPDVLAFRLKKGRQLVGTRSGLPLSETDCVSCGQCVNACPCGALDYKRERGKVFRAINDEKKKVVGFVAPAVRSVISSTFNVPFEKASEYMAGLLKGLGFDYVFDFSFSADLTIVEETTEFLKRVNTNGKMPQFTSCCPGWVNFVEKRYPEIIPHLSSCKSPQQMMGAVLKNHFAGWAKVPIEDLYVVSIVPCLAKKTEAARPEYAPNGKRDVDAVLTTSELIEMIKLVRFDTASVQPMQFDEPYRMVSGAGVLFGASGGVAEATLRMAVEKLSGETPTKEAIEFKEVRGFAGVKETLVSAGGKNVRVAVVSGLANVIPLIERQISHNDIGYDLIEVMACPGGCICGAGHPVPEKVDTLGKRQNVLVDIDKTSKYRKSQENPDILRLYKEFIGEPNSDAAHRLLHTNYKPFRESSSPDKMPHSDSAFVSHLFSVCVCDKCEKMGSRKLFEDVKGKIDMEGMDTFIDVTTIRLDGNHDGASPFVMLDGKKVQVEDLNNLYNSVRKERVTK
ncbi:MAG: FAD-dependent oxidoreductase [Fibrobacteres bacterium]|nr:FAD-dependent oxidoreductase [Fibrobacterota bacterium]